MEEKTKIRLFLLFFCVVTFTLTLDSLKNMNKAYLGSFIAFYCLFAYFFLVFAWEETKWETTSDAWMARRGDTNWDSCADINGDGFVSGWDLSILSDNWMEEYLYI